MEAVITGDTVTRLIIPIRGRGKITYQKNYQDEDKKSAVNKYK